MKNICKKICIIKNNAVTLQKIKLLLTFKNFTTMSTEKTNKAQSANANVIQNTTLNQLLERAKQVRKEVNSLNGVLKALYKEDIFKNLFDAIDLKTYDEVRLAVIKAIAYCSEDNNGNFIAVTLKPVISTEKANIYKVSKLDWFTAIAQATYRLSKGFERVQELTIDSYYLPSAMKGIFTEVTDESLVTDIDNSLKIQKYNKAVERANKLKLEF